MSFEDFNKSECLKSVEDRPNVLLIGDSFGAHLWYGLANRFTFANIQQATAAGCRPTITRSVGASKECSKLMDYVFSNHLSNGRTSKVLISARWSDADADRVEQTLIWLDKNRVSAVLFGPMVQYDAPLPLLLAHSIRNNDKREVDNHRIDTFRELDKKMRIIAFAHNTAYVSFFDMLCDSSSCETLDKQGNPLQFDYGHLTKVGSFEIAHRLYKEGNIIP